MIFLNYLKILKDINAAGKRLHMISIEVSELKYPPDKSDKYRAAYITLKAEGYIEIISNSAGKILYVERLPKCIGLDCRDWLSNHERWKERVAGYIWGLVTSALTYLITKQLIPAAVNLIQTLEDRL